MVGQRRDEDETREVAVDRVHADQEFEQLQARAVQHVRPQGTQQRLEQLVQLCNVASSQELSWARERAGGAVADERRLKGCKEVGRAASRSCGRHVQLRQC